MSSKNIIFEKVQFQETFLVSLDWLKLQILLLLSRNCVNFRDSPLASGE
jgi:hypothetical protein